jgi:hypothetical protein
MTTNRVRLVARIVPVCLLAALLGCSARRTGADTATVPQPDGRDAAPAETGPTVAVDSATTADTSATPPADVAVPADASAVPVETSVAAPGDAGAADASPVVVRWNVSTLWGGERIEISAGGQVLYVVLAGPGSPGGREQEYRGTATPAEMEGLRKTFDDNDVCDIESERETGIPDEGHPTLQVSFPGMECTISLWDGEWLERDKPRACQEALHAIARRFVPAS